MEFCLLGIAEVIVNYWFLDLALNQYPLLWILLPLNIIGNIYLIPLLASCFSWFFLKILRKIEPPKEGIFPIDGREFKYYSRRFWICYFPIALFRSIPLPWADMVAFRMFGVKVGKSVVLYDGWVDFEFVEIGDYVMLSLNSALISHCVYENHFLVGKVIIKKNSIVGAQSVVAPGTILEEGAVLGVSSTTKINQRLEGYSTHMGNPAFKSLPIKITDKRIK